MSTNRPDPSSPTASRLRTATLDGLPIELDEIAEDFLNACRQGKTVSIEAVAQQFPDYAAEIREIFPALQMLEGTVRAEEELPESIGPYRVVELLGRGGMGVVYRAIQPGIERDVAIKVLPASKFGSPEARKRFEREARAVGKLRHPNIVQIHEVGRVEDSLYYTMQVVDGFSLRQLITHHRLKNSEALASTREGAQSTLPLGNENSQGTAEHADAQPRSSESHSESHSESPPDSILETTFSREHWEFAAGLGRDVAVALQHAHENSVIHRDIKPSNIMLDELGKAWVTDFGLAKLEDDEDRTATGIVLGTLRYMSPEQFSGQSVPQSDQYSLGATLYELLTLRAIGEDGSLSTVSKRAACRPPEFPAESASRIPRDLRTIVQRCLRGAPGERYESMQDLAEDLDRFIQHRPIMARRPTTLERFRWFVLEHKAALAAACATLLVAGLLAYLFMPRPEPDVVLGYPDKETAQWVLEQSGNLTLVFADGASRVFPGDEIPERAFNIEEIYLESCEELTRERLRELLSLPRLRTISLTRSNFDESWSEELLERPELKSIGLAGCNVTDHTARILSQMKKVEYLGLNHNDISDEGVKILSTMGTIGELTLASNPRLTNDCMKHLLELEFLTLVDVRYTGVTESAARPVFEKMQRSGNSATLYFGDDDDGTETVWRTDFHE